MARTPSTMRELGSKAPNFSLPDLVSGETMKLPLPGEAKAIVIMFICNHCPFVKHVSKQLTALGNDYQKKGVAFFAINSNDIVTYPEDNPIQMKLTAQEAQYPFPYLFDETQAVAKAYDAACTPDFFVYDSNLTLVYRGQLDDSRPGNNEPVNGHSIRSALDCILEDKPLLFAQLPSIGCNIKWKQGQ